MAGRKLAYTVSVQDDDGDMHSFGPSDTVPAWAQKAITNPGAWEDGESNADAGAGPAAAGDTPAIPPKGGAGSAAENWRGYARSQGVDVAEDATREDVVAALEAAGIATE